MAATQEEIYVKLAEQYKKEYEAAKEANDQKTLSKLEKEIEVLSKRAETLARLKKDSENLDANKYQSPSYKEMFSEASNSLSQATKTFTGKVSEIIEDYNNNVFEPSELEGKKESGGVLQVLDPIKEEAAELSAALTMLGGKAAIPFAADVATTGLKTVAQAVTPDFIEEPLVNFAFDKAKNAADWVKTSDWAQAPIAIAKKSFKDYLDWKESSTENTVRGDLLESSFNIAALSLPPTKVPPITETLGDVGEKIIKKGQEVSDKDIVNRSNDLMSPPNWATKKSDLGGKLVAKGMFQIKSYELAPIEQKSADLLAKLAGIGGGRKIIDLKRTNVTNTTKVDNLISLKAADLKKKLERNPTKINVDKVLTDIGNEVTEKVKKESLFGSKLTKEERKYAGAILGTAIDQIKKNKPTSAGLLQARQDIDKLIRKDAPQMFEAVTSNNMSVQRQITRIVRNAINDAIDAENKGEQLLIRKGEKLPDSKKDSPRVVDVKGSLDEQSTLFFMRDRFEEKALLEETGPIGRNLANVNAITGAQFPTTPLAVIATGSVAGGFFLGFAPEIALGAASFAVYKALNKGKGTKFLGNLLKQTSKAMKKTVNPEMLAQLKADRLILIDLLEDLKESEGTESKATE